MIMLIIFLIASILAVAVIAVTITFGYQNRPIFRKLIIVLVAAALLTGLFCAILGGIYRNEINQLSAEYENIMLYHEIVNECDNEEVRFGHYEKIAAFNELYNSIVAQSESKWFGGLIPMDWSYNMAPIDFVFRGIYSE